MSSLNTSTNFDLIQPLVENLTSDDNLIMRLNFEQVSNSVITDISPYGSSNNGFLKNGATVSNTNTPFKNVASFDGQNDYIHINDSADINLGNYAKRTISLWFKVDDKTISSRKQVIYEEGGTTKGLNIYVFNGRLYVGGWNSPESVWNGTFLSTDRIASKTWHHVALVLDAQANLKTVQTGVFSAYLDGQKFGQGSGSQLWQHSADIGLGNINQQTLFHDRINSSIGGFKGNIDDVKIYNRALTSQEIAILGQVNHSPIAQSNTFQTSEDNNLAILGATLLSNDSDVDSDTLTITGINSANTTGEVSFDGTNIIYRPARKFDFLGVGETATDSFVYTISDGHGGTASASATITINGINDVPVAVADSGTTNRNQPITFLSTNLLSNDRDPDGDILQITSVRNAINGSVTLDVQRNPIFTPNLNFSGNASFDYVVSDSNGGTATATVKVTVNSVLALPDLVTKYHPNSLPSLPTGSDTFAPSFVQNVGISSLNGLTPQIAEWTRTGARGETLVLTGWQFSNLTGAASGNDTKFWVYGQTNGNNGVLVEATLQKLDGDIAAITLPDSLPQGSSFLVWAQNSTGYSKPVMINQTESWWLQETATKGRVASVFGRNLSQDGGTQMSRVYLEDFTGKGYWAEVVDVNPYKVDFKVPNGLANGNYQVYVHNGDGGQYGWSKPLTMTINDGLNYKGPVFNVKNFGAKGDGITDDTAAIKAALAAADKTPWASVYLPKGTYIVSESLNPGWDKLRWLGDSKDLTTIKAANGFDKHYLFQNNGINGITFQNLTLDANVKNAKIMNTVTYIRGSSDIQYLNVRINAEGTTPFDWHNNRSVFMKDSEVIGQGSFLGTAKQVFIDKSQFFGTNYSDTILNGFGTQMVSITNSIGQNLDTSDPNNGKWIKGRFFSDQANWGISQYHYIGNNQTIDLAPPPATGIDRNSGEQIMWESNTPSVSFGAVTIATINTVTFESATAVDSAWHITITGGKGIGQSRQVKSFDKTTNTYEIYDGWNVLPDRSSTIVASRIVSKAVVYGNTLDGTAEAYNSPTHVASQGVQTYQGAANLIIDNNSFHELRAGVALWSGGADGFSPIYFTQVSNNTFEDELTGVYFPWISEQQGTNIIGSIVRSNSLNNVNTGVEIQIDPRLPINGNSFPNVNMNVFENNILGNVGQFMSLEQTNNNIHNNILLQNDSLQNNLSLGVISNALVI